MHPRRPALVVGALVTLLLAGCGSQSAPVAAEVSRNSQQVNGTSPSPSTMSPVPTSPVPASTAPTTPAPPSTPSVDPRSFSIVDPSTGDFVAGIASGAVVLGGVGIHGVGAAWGTRRIHVTRSDEGVVADYDGPGRLQRGADLGLGVATLTTLVRSDLGEPEAVRLRFHVRLDAAGLGGADVWVDEHHYRLSVREPPHTADPVVAAVVAAFRAEDWSSLYDLTTHFPGMTRAAFVRAFGGDGSITSLELTGETVYRMENGIPFADAPAHVVATIGKRRLDRDVAVELVYREGKWRFNSLAKGVDGN